MAPPVLARTGAATHAKWAVYSYLHGKLPGANPSPSRRPACLNGKKRYPRTPPRTRVATGW